MAALMSKTELEEALMTIVVGLDVHREQITFDALDTHTGEVRRGRIRPADRDSFRRFLSRFERAPVEAALEATTGWRFIVEELQAAESGIRLRNVLPSSTGSRSSPAKSFPHPLDAAFPRRLVRWLRSRLRVCQTGHERRAVPAIVAGVAVCGPAGGAAGAGEEWRSLQTRRAR
jgi:hypothetical protein